MATKHYCDRCGREVKDFHWYWISYTREETCKSSDTVSRILCPECWRVVVDSIKPLEATK